MRKRKAGLKINVARNILRGQSKRPTAETLQAIATAMDCTVQDLLGVQKEVLPSQIKHPAESGLFLETPEVLNEALQCILQVIQNNGYKLTVKQTLLLLWSNAFGCWWNLLRIRNGQLQLHAQRGG